MATAIASENLSRLCEIDIDQFDFGTKLDYSIYDDTGVLLVTAGTIFDSELKQRLVNKGPASLQALADDLISAAGHETGKSAFEFESELSQQMDGIISQSGIFSVDESDERMSDQVLVNRGGHDPEIRESVKRQQEKTCSAIDDMMRKALKGETSDGEHIMHFVASFVSSLAGDVDCTLSAAFEASDDPSIVEQSLRTSLLSMALAVEMGMSPQAVSDIGAIALVQNWGMAKVPVPIRQKKGPLTQAEKYELQKHPIYSLDLLLRCPRLPSMAAVVAYQIHERPDGSGYPRGTSSSKIHPYAKIISVADAYEALVSCRPYRPPLMPHAAVECLLREAKINHFDRDVVRALIHVLTLFPIGSLVVLSDDSKARVIRRNGGLYHQPIVQIVADAGGNQVVDGEIVDLSSSDLSILKAIGQGRAGEIKLSDAILNRALACETL